MNKQVDFLKPKKVSSVLKPILIVFGVVIVMEVLFGLKSLLTPVKIAPKKTEVSVLSGGSINLTLAKANYRVGEVVPVAITLSTGNHLTAGTDLVLKYDPLKLEASPSSFTAGKTTYDEFPPINVNPLVGQVRVSGVAAVGKVGFNGRGDFGILEFKAKQSGSTEISLDFKPNLTNDSNMVEVGTDKDILETINSVKVNIQ